MRTPREWDPVERRWLRLGGPRLCATCGQATGNLRWKYCADHAPATRDYYRCYQREHADERREYQRELRGYRPLREYDCSRCVAHVRGYVDDGLCRTCRHTWPRRRARYAERT